MEFYELLLIAVGLSMDAMAVSVGAGLSGNNVTIAHAAKAGGFFGFFQAAMPLIGYLLGTTFSTYIEAAAHYVVFALLSFIGARMIYETFKHRADAQGATANPFATGPLLTMAVATSIDALAVGIGLAVLKTDVFVSVIVIGATTFTLSAAGVMLGKKLGGVCKNWAGILGGAVLILIGVKTLIERIIAA